MQDIIRLYARVGQGEKILVDEKSNFRPSDSAL